EGNAACNQAAEHAERIGKIEGPDMRERNFSACRFGFYSYALFSNPFRKEIRRSRNAVTQCVCARSLRELAAEGIVEVEHRGLEPCLLEELRLRFPVGCHGAVVVEVVLREVGEERAVEGDAVDAALVEAVRRHFHRRGARALVPEFLEQAMELER